MEKVTDPDLLKQLNSSETGSSKSTKVTDPSILAQLNGETESVLDGEAEPEKTEKGFVSSVVDTVKGAGQELVNDPAQAALAGGSAAAESYGSLKGGELLSKGLGKLGLNKAIATGVGMIPGVRVIKPLVEPALGMLEFAGGAALTQSGIKKGEEAIGISDEINKSQAANPDISATAGTAVMGGMAVKSLKGYKNMLATEGLGKTAVQAGGAAAGGAAFPYLDYGARKGINAVAGEGTVDEIPVPTSEDVMRSARDMALLGGMEYKSGAKPTETQVATPEPEPVDPQIESQVDDLLASASPATAQAVKETSVKSTIKTGADLENPMRPLAVDEVSSTTPPPDKAEQVPLASSADAQAGIIRELEEARQARQAKPKKTKASKAETLVEEAPLPDQQIEAETPATPVAPTAETPTEQIRTANQFLENRGGLARLKLNERLPATDKNSNGLPSLSELLDGALREQDVETLQWVHNEMQQRMSKPSFQKEQMMLRARNAIETLTGQAPVAPELKVSGENGAPRVIKGGPELNPALKAAAERSLAIDQSRIQSAAKPVEPVTSEEPTETEKEYLPEPIPAEKGSEESEKQFIDSIQQKYPGEFTPDIIQSLFRAKTPEEFTKWSATHYPEMAEDPTIAQSLYLETRGSDTAQQTPQINATDGAYKRAQQLEVNIAEVQASKNGRITAGDVQKHVKNLNKAKIKTPVKEEPVESADTIDESQPNYWYREGDEDSKELFGEVDSLTQQIKNETDPEAKEGLVGRLNKLRLEVQKNPDLYFRADLNNPSARIHTAEGEQTASLKGARWKDLGTINASGMALREVSLADGTSGHVDLNALPEPVKDLIDNNTPVLERNISRMAEALGVTRNTVYKWEKLGMPVNDPDQARAWYAKKVADGTITRSDSEALNNAVSIDRSLGDSTSTIGDTYVGTDPTRPTTEADNSTAALVNRAIAHISRTDVPILRRLSLAKMLTRGEIADRLGLSDEEYKRLDAAHDELQEQLLSGNLKDSNNPSNQEYESLERLYASFDELGDKISLLEDFEGGVTSEKVQGLVDIAKAKGTLSPEDIKELARFEGEKDKNNNLVNSPEEVLEQLKEKLEKAKERLTAAQKIWGETQGVEQGNDSKENYLNRLNDIAERISEKAIEKGYTADQLMDNVDGRSKFEVSPLRAIDAGSQGETQQRGEVIRETHAEDALQKIAADPKNDSMVNLVAQHLLDRFAKSGRLLRTPVDIHNRLESGVLGEYDPATGRIALEENSAAETILEEVLHSLTADRNLPREIHDLFKKIQKEAVKKGLTSREQWTSAADPTVLNKGEGDAFHYAFSNPHELLAAALKNREVRDALNDLEVRDSITGKLVSAWKYLKGELFKWLGFNVKKDSALDQYLNKMFDHMSEGDLENNTLDTEGGDSVLYAYGNENNQSQASEEARRLSERLAQRRAGNQKVDAARGGSDLQNVLRVTERVSGRDSSSANRGWAEAGLESLRSLEDWAEKSGKVIPSEGIISELRSNRALDEGSEHSVVRTRDGKRVIKVTHDDMLGTGVVGQSANVNDYLKGLEYQNILFGGKNPENHYTFDGLVYLDDAEGRPQLVVSQPYVGGKNATEAQIAKFFKDRGFVKKDGYWKGTQDGYTYTIGDAVPANVKAFKNSDGELIVQPIDVQVSREPAKDTGKLRAISITPQKAKLTRSLEKDLLTADPEVRAMLAGKTYIPESFKQWADVAEDWITNRVQAGDSNRDIARKLLAGANAGLSSEQEIVTAKYIVAQQAKVLKFALEKEIKSAGVKTIADEVQLAEYTTTGNELTRELSERATLAGKMLSVFRMIAGNMNGRYIIDEYLAPTFKAQAAKLSGDKTARELKTALQGSIETGAEETVGRARTLIRKIFQSPKDIQDGFAQSVFDFFDAVRDADNTSPSKNSTPLGIQYAEKAAASLAKKIAGSVSKESRVQGPALEILQKNIQTEISARMREVFAGIEAKPDFNREAAVKSLAEGLDISELSERAFDSARESVLANPDAKITPAQRVALEGAKFDGGAMKKAQDILRQEVVFRDVVKKTLSDRTASREALIGEIISNSDLSPEQAVRVADSLRQTYEFEARKAAKTQLDALVKNKEARDAKAGIKQIKEADIQKLLKLVNMGAFTEEKFYNAIADSYKLPTWDEAFAKQIEKEAEDVQALPEGQYRNQRTGDLLNKIATKKTDEVLRGHSKSGRVAKILDITTAAWQAGVLSGPPTQAVNLLGSHASVVAETLMESIGYAYKAKDLRYMTEGLSAIYSSILGKRSQQEIGRALKEGTTQYKVNQMEGASNLENLDPTNLPPVMKQLASYAGNLKYVGRAMQALDAMNMVSADEAKQRMATRFFLEQKQGKSTAEVNKIIADLFYPDQTITDGLRATAEKEAASGMYGDSKAEQEKWIKRRMSELLQKNREEIYSGVTEQGTNFAEHATYNEQSYGILGKFVAGTASQMNSELKVTKFILSFMNTLSNIMNQSLDYTVWGSVRAMNKSFSQQRFNENSKYAPRKFEEGSPEQAAQFAKSILGTTAFLSLTYMAYKGLLEEQEGKEPFFSIHGAGPQNSMDKQQLIATQNWQPNSVRVGGKWFRYTDWPAIGLALGGLGAIYDAVRYKKDEQTTNELIQAAALSTASTVLQKNMLQGVTTFIDAIGGSKTSSQATAMSRLTSGVVGGYTNPGLFRWARNTFGMDKSGQVARLEQGTTEGWLYSMVPFSMGYNTPALNTLGEPIKQPWYSATTWRFTNASNIPPHPIISPILRAGLMLPNPSKATEFRFLDAQGAIVKGKMGKYPELNRRFVQIRGELMKEMLSPSVIEQLQELSKENKNQAQEYLDSKIGGAARNQAVKMIEAELMDGKLKLG